MSDPKEVVPTGCAVVLGASSGIGRALCRVLATEGCDVVAAARRMDRLHDLKSESVANARHVWPVAADATDISALRRVLDYGEAEFGSIERVFHSVGHHIPLEFLADASEETLRAAVDTLLMSAIYTTAESLRRMRRTGGKVLLVSSGAATSSTPGRAAYSASKAAVNALIRSVGAEIAGWQRDDIAVAGIVPGRVDTPMQRELMLAAAKASPAFRLERFMSPRDVADPAVVAAAIAELSARDAIGLNGQLFRYDPMGWNVLNSSGTTQAGEGGRTA